MELTGRRRSGALDGDEKSERLKEDWALEATSESNDWLGSCAGFVAALGRNTGGVDGGRTMDGERTWDCSVVG